MIYYVVKHASGSAARCYWYRSSKYGAAKLNKEFKNVLILHANKDNTYTVEFDDGSVLDDVPEKYLKTVKDLDKELLKAVVIMRREEDSSSEGSTNDMDDLLSATGMAQDEKVERILGRRLLEEYDKYYDTCLRELSTHWNYNDLTRALKMTGGLSQLNPTSTEIWVKTHMSHHSLKTIEFWHFILIYANIKYSSSSSDLSSTRDVSKLGRTLNEKSYLKKFQQTYGNRMLVELEDTFYKFAEKQVEEQKMPARSLMDAFVSLGKAITVSKLSGWMAEADVHMHDYLSLADFAAAYGNLFPLRLEKTKQSGVVLLDSLSNVASQIMREERWSGSEAQVQDLITRLCAGRSDAVVNVIGKIRNAFELLDREKHGYLPSSYIHKIFHETQITPNEISSLIIKFLTRMESSASASFSLIEVFEFFGSCLQQYAESILSVGEATSLLRLRLDNNAVYKALKLSLSVAENILDHPTERKYWFVNIDAETFNRAVWYSEEGKKLMRSIGFGDPFELTDEKKVSRKVISLRGVNVQAKQISPEVLRILKVKCDELRSEICALEGAPSISAAVREMRLHHSLTEVRLGLETALKIVQNVLGNPHDIKMFRVKKANPVFQRDLGRLRGAELLMNAIGYSNVASTDINVDGDPSAYVLKPKLVSNTVTTGGQYYVNQLLVRFI
ncbi:hypothetical protein EON65_10590 [archaeon]|nr:MAG: hypothetical protein EON65_10590 [archaeon]